MDNTQVTIALLGSITSVITSVIAGYFAIRTAQVEQKRIKKNKDGVEKNETASRQSFSLINSLIFSFISIPLSFIFALLGNWVSGTPREFLLDDSLDAAIIVPVTFFLSYVISANLFIEKTKVTRILFPAIIIGVLFIPFLSIVGFAVNFILSPEYLEFRLISADVASQSYLFRFNIGAFFDSMILAMLSILVGFIIGGSKKRASRFHKINAVLKTAQQSVHLTLGSLRTSQAVLHALSFFWLDGFAVPAPAQVTQTVGRLGEIDYQSINDGWD